MSALATLVFYCSVLLSCAPLAGISNEVAFDSTCNTLLSENSLSFCLEALTHLVCWFFVVVCTLYVFLVCTLVRALAYLFWRWLRRLHRTQPKVHEVSYYGHSNYRFFPLDYSPSPTRKRWIPRGCCSPLVNRCEDDDLVLARFLAAQTSYIKPVPTPLVTTLIPNAKRAVVVTNPVTTPVVTPPACFKCANTSLLCTKHRICSTCSHGKCTQCFSQIVDQRVDSMLCYYNKYRPIITSITDQPGATCGQRFLASCRLIVPHAPSAKGKCRFPISQFNRSVRYHRHLFVNGTVIPGQVYAQLTNPATNQAHIELKVAHHATLGYALFRVKTSAIPHVYDIPTFPVYSNVDLNKCVVGVNVSKRGKRTSNYSPRRPGTVIIPGEAIKIQYRRIRLADPVFEHPMYINTPSDCVYGTIRRLEEMLHGANHFENICKKSTSQDTDEWGHKDLVKDTVFASPPGAFANIYTAFSRGTALYHPMARSFLAVKECLLQEDSMGFCVDSPSVHGGIKTHHCAAFTVFNGAFSRSDGKSINTTSKYYTLYTHDKAHPTCPTFVDINEIHGDLTTNFGNDIFSERSASSTTGVYNVVVDSSGVTIPVLSTIGHAIVTLANVHSIPAGNYLLPWTLFNVSGANTVIPTVDASSPPNTADLEYVPFACYKSKEEAFTAVYGCDFKTIDMANICLYNTGTLEGNAVGNIVFPVVRGEYTGIVQFTGLFNSVGVPGLVANMFTESTTSSIDLPPELLIPCLSPDVTPQQSYNTCPIEIIDSDYDESCDEDWEVSSTVVNTDNIDVDVIDSEGFAASSAFDSSYVTTLLGLNTSPTITTKSALDEILEEDESVSVDAEGSTIDSVCYSSTYDDFSTTKSVSIPVYTPAVPDVFYDSIFTEKKEATGSGGASNGSAPPLEVLDNDNGIVDTVSLRPNSDDFIAHCNGVKKTVQVVTITTAMLSDTIICASHEHGFISGAAGQAAIVMKMLGITIKGQEFPQPLEVMVPKQSILHRRVTHLLAPRHAKAYTITDTQRHAISMMPEVKTIYIPFIGAGIFDSSAVSPELVAEFIKYAPAKVFNIVCHTVNDRLCFNSLKYLLSDPVKQPVAPKDDTIFSIQGHVHTSACTTAFGENSVLYPNSSVEVDNVKQTVCVNYQYKSTKYNCVPVTVQSISDTLNLGYKLTFTRRFTALLIWCFISIISKLLLVCYYCTLKKISLLVIDNVSFTQRLLYSMVGTYKVGDTYITVQKPGIVSALDLSVRRIYAYVFSTGSHVFIYDGSSSQCVGLVRDDGVVHKMSIDAVKEKYSCVLVIYETHPPDEHRYFRWSRVRTCLLVVLCCVVSCVALLCIHYYTMQGDHSYVVMYLQSVKYFYVRAADMCQAYTSQVHVSSIFGDTYYDGPTYCMAVRRSVLPEVVYLEDKTSLVAVTKIITATNVEWLKLFSYTIFIVFNVSHCATMYFVPYAIVWGMYGMGYLMYYVAIEYIPFMLYVTNIQYFELWNYTGAIYIMVVSGLLYLTNSYRRCYCIHMSCKHCTPRSGYVINYNAAHGGTINTALTTSNVWCPVHNHYCDHKEGKFSPLAIPSIQRRNRLVIAHAEDWVHVFISQLPENTRICSRGITRLVLQTDCVSLSVAKKRLQAGDYCFAISATTAEANLARTIAHAFVDKYSTEVVIVLDPKVDGTTTDTVRAQPGDPCTMYSQFSSVTAHTASALSLPIKPTLPAYFIFLANPANPDYSVDVASATVFTDEAQSWLPIALFNKLTPRVLINLNNHLAKGDKTMYVVADNSVDFHGTSCRGFFRLFVYLCLVLNVSAERFTFFHLPTMTYVKQPNCVFSQDIGAYGNIPRGSIGECPILVPVLSPDEVTTFGTYPYMAGLWYARYNGAGGNPNDLVLCTISTFFSEVVYNYTGYSTSLDGGSYFGLTSISNQVAEFGYVNVTELPPGTYDIHLLDQVYKWTHPTIYWTFPYIYKIAGNFCNVTVCQDISRQICFGYGPTLDQSICFRFVYDSLYSFILSTIEPAYQHQLYKPMFLLFILAIVGWRFTVFFEEFRRRYESRYLVYMHSMLVVGVFFVSSSLYYMGVPGTLFIGHGIQSILLYNSATVDTNDIMRVLHRILVYLFYFASLSVMTWPYYCIALVVCYKIYRRTNPIVAPDGDTLYVKVGDDLKFNPDIGIVAQYNLTLDHSTIQRILQDTGTNMGDVVTKMGRLMFFRNKLRDSSCDPSIYKEYCAAHLASVIHLAKTTDKTLTYDPPSITVNTTMPTTQGKLQAAVLKMCDPAGSLEQCACRVVCGTKALSGFVHRGKVRFPRHLLDTHFKDSGETPDVFYARALKNATAVVVNGIYEVSNMEMQNTMIVGDVTMPTPDISVKFGSVNIGDTFTVMQVSNGHLVGLYPVVMSPDFTVRGAFRPGTCGSIGYRRDGEEFTVVYFHHLEVSTDKHTGCDGNGVFYGTFVDTDDLQQEDKVNRKVFTPNYLALVALYIKSGCYFKIGEVSLSDFLQHIQNNEKLFTPFSAQDVKVFNVFCKRINIDPKYVYHGVLDADGLKGYRFNYKKFFSFLPPLYLTNGGDYNYKDVESFVHNSTRLQSSVTVFPAAQYQLAKIRRATPYLRNFIFQFVLSFLVVVLIWQAFGFYGANPLHVFTTSIGGALLFMILVPSNSIFHYVAFVPLIVFNLLHFIPLDYLDVAYWLVFAISVTYYIIYRMFTKHWYVVLCYAFNFVITGLSYYYVEDLAINTYYYKFWLFISLLFASKRLDYQVVIGVGGAVAHHYASTLSISVLGYLQFLLMHFPLFHTSEYIVARVLRTLGLLQWAYFDPFYLMGFICIYLLVVLLFCWRYGIFAILSWLTGLPLGKREYLISTKQFFVLVRSGCALPSSYLECLAFDHATRQYRAHRHIRLQSDLLIAGVSSVYSILGCCNLTPDDERRLTYLHNDFCKFPSPDGFLQLISFGLDVGDTTIVDVVAKRMEALFMSAGMSDEDQLQLYKNLISIPGVAQLLLTQTGDKMYKMLADTDDVYKAFITLSLCSPQPILGKLQTTCVPKYSLSESVERMRTAKQNYERVCSDTTDLSIIARYRKASNIAEAEYKVAAKFDMALRKLKTTVAASQYKEQKVAEATTKISSAIASAIHRCIINLDIDKLMSIFENNAQGVPMHLLNALISSRIRILILNYDQYVKYQVTKVENGYTFVVGGLTYTAKVLHSQSQKLDVENIITADSIYFPLIVNGVRVSSVDTGFDVADKVESLQATEINLRTISMVMGYAYREGTGNEPVVARLLCNSYNGIKRVVACITKYSDIVGVSFDKQADDGVCFSVMKIPINPAYDRNLYFAVDATPAERATVLSFVYNRTLLQHYVDVSLQTLYTNLLFAADPCIAYKEQNVVLKIPRVVAATTSTTSVVTNVKASCSPGYSCYATHCLCIKCFAQQPHIEHDYPFYMIPMNSADPVRFYLDHEVCQACRRWVNHKGGLGCDCNQLVANLQSVDGTLPLNRSSDFKEQVTMSLAKSKNLRPSTWTL